jgi:PAS domain-containing protein
MDVQRRLQPDRAHTELESQNRALQLELDRARTRRRKTTDERLALIFDSAIEYAIFALDPEGRVTSWNRGAQRLLGYSDHEIIGQDGRVLFTAGTNSVVRPIGKSNRR